MILVALVLLAQTAVAEPAPEVNPMPIRNVKITSERTTYDRKEGVIMFDKNVFVNDPEYQMYADQLYVFLDGTNELKRIVALGNVALTNELETAGKKELRAGRCAKATYSKSSSKLVMYGDEASVAQLETVGKDTGSVSGKKITFWLDSEQVEVEGRPEVILDASRMNGKGGMKKMLGN